MASSSNFETMPQSPTESPISVIVLGMAASGKTSLVSSLVSYLEKSGSPPYTTNIDPAVIQVPYNINIDIRDTVDYKGVMKKYSLGPNAGIATSLLLFSTKFDQVMNILSQRASSHKYFLFDTPGQVEIFTWSASSSIISESLATAYPTVILYLVDTKSCMDPICFMSNMIYACSIYLKSRLPFILVFSKTDIVDCSQAMEWMKDFEQFHAALEKEKDYSSSLTYTSSLFLDTFYQDLKAVGVSAVSGDGMEDLVKAIQEARLIYEKDFKPIYQTMKNLKSKKIVEAQLSNLDKLNLNEVPNVRDNMRLHTFDDEESGDDDGDDEDLRED